MQDFMEWLTGIPGGESRPRACTIRDLEERIDELESEHRIQEAELRKLLARVDVLERKQRKGDA